MRVIRGLFSAVCCRPRGKQHTHGLMLFQTRTTKNKTFEIVACKISAILLRLKCVSWWKTQISFDTCYERNREIDYITGPKYLTLFQCIYNVDNMSHHSGTFYLCRTYPVFEITINRLVKPLICDNIQSQTTRDALSLWHNGQHFVDDIFQTL